MTRHCWLDGSLGLNSKFAVRANLLRLESISDGYRSVRRVIRIEFFGLSVQIGVGKGCEA